MHDWSSLSTKFQLKLTTLIFWTKFDQKRYFRLKTEKVNHVIEFCIFKLVEVPNFSLSRQLWLFWDIFAPKKYLWHKTEKVNITIKFYIFQLVKESSFSLNWQFWFFGVNLTKKSISGLKRKSENHYWILYISITLGVPNNNFDFLN